MLALLSGIIASAGFSKPTMAAAPNDLVNQMLRDGFDPGRANLLFGQWSDAKHIMVEFAKSGDRAKIDLAHRIVDYKFTAWEQNWTSTVDDLVTQGISRPIEGMGPTGGWKAPLTYKNSDPVRFIIDGANADIDATFFGRNPNVTEEFVERAAIKWAARTSGTNVMLPDGSPDYAKINQILKASEVTPFPRNPDGIMSEAFRQKFPEIVHESYPGAYGQRSLEVEYMITDKGKADIVRYDKSGNLVKKGNQVQLTRDQGAETLIEDLTNARYTRLDRMNRLAADYNEKYLGHLGQGAKQDAETTAKMLQRMIEGDSRLRGFRPGGHPLYDKAKAVKQALREGDDDLLKKALGGQSLDDFMQQAQGEMRRINIRNQSRLTEMVDDSLGTASATRMNTAIRALTLLGYGVMTTDAVMRARTGEEVKEGSKALATMVAADLAGSAVGSAIGGLTGFASGVGTAMVVGMVVSGTLEWTEEGIENMLAGYKVDAAMRSIFLNKDTMDRFLNMKPEEIREIIEREWDAQQQWGGAYLGKHGDPVEQLKRKKEIFEKAMQMQSLINKNKLRSQIVAEIVNDELRKLVERFEKGEISPEELAEAREKFRNNATGLWAAIFGTGLEAMINERLETDYARYGSLFDELDTEPEIPGLWDALFGDAEEREAARNRADENYGLLMEDKASLLESLGYMNRLLQQIREEFINGGDVSSLFNELNEELDVLSGSFALLEGLARSVLADLNESYGKEEDLTLFYERRSAITAMLAELNKNINDKKILVGNLKAELDKLKKAAAEQAIAGMQGKVDELEKMCAQIAVEVGLAETSLNEAGRIAGLLQDTMSTEGIESALSDVFAACATVGEVQAGATKAAQNAMQSARGARGSYDGALKMLQRCANSQALSTADTLLDDARSQAREAAQAYSRALQGSDTLEQISTDAREAKNQLESSSKNIQQTGLYFGAYKNHVDNARTSRKRIPELVESCKQKKGVLLQEFNGLMGQYPWLENEATALALKGRIDGTGPAVTGDAVDQRFLVALGIEEDVQKNAKATAEKISKYRALLDVCEGAGAPLLEILQSAEALLGLEKFAQWRANVEGKKKACLAKLDKKEQVAVGACEGENWYPGCDPNVTGEGSTATGTQLTRAQQAAEGFQRPPAGDTPGEGGQDGQTGVVALPPGYTQDVEAETPPAEEQPPVTEDEEGVVSDEEVVADSIADEFGTPTFPTRPTRPAPSAPAVPPVATAPTAPPDPQDRTAAVEDPCNSQGPGCYTRPDGKGCICPEADKPVSGGEAMQPAQPVEEPKERYGVFLLFDNKSAIWVGPESRLQNRASGTVKYGGMCKDVKKCPVVYTLKKGPFDTEEQAYSAYCEDLEAGPWWSLGVRRVRMKWRENAYAASKVPSCQ